MHHVSGLELGEFMVMPNHLHGVMALSGEGGSLSSVVRSCESMVSRHAHRSGFIFAWQRNY
jgi:hypothetical protein